MTTGLASSSTSYQTYSVEKHHATQTPYNRGGKQPQYHYASTMQGVMAPSSFSIVPVGRYHQQQMQFFNGGVSKSIGHTQIQRQMPQNPARNFFVFDQPVAVNGRQINFPASNYEKVDSRQIMNIKKGGSAGFLHPN